jgi:phytol kinase
MTVVATVLVVLGLLVINEHWFRTRKVRDEVSRKFIHLSVGTFVAAWPFYLSWNEIRLLSVAFLVVVGVSKYFKIFKAIHSVTRPTWGEIFFAISVGLLTYITHSKGIYAVCLLQMAWADGLAAIVGTKYGKPYEYKVFGHTKSLVGSGTFMFVSYVLLLGYTLSSTSLGIGTSLGIAIIATMAENVAIAGLDNLIVPLVVALLIRLFV